MLRALSFGSNLSDESQRLYLAMTALGCALLPHFLAVPLWIPLLIGCVTLWRIIIEVRAWRLPPKWLRIVVAVVCMAAIAGTFRTLNGLDAGSALLATMAGLKLLETRGSRDHTIVIFIGYVLLFAALLYDQSLARLPYIVICLWLLSGALLRIHRQSQMPRARVALKTSATLLLQALPVALLLFIFFPRLPGQFWALPARNNALTGLSDEMTPGDISELTVSGAVAFRVQFAGALPPPAERYWRGPVLHEFDGRRWRRDREQSFIMSSVASAGPSYEYRLTMEPTQRQWIMALDTPTKWSEGIARVYDQQLLTRRAISSISSFNLVSDTHAVTDLKLSRTLRAIDTALPGTGNPRTRALARQLRASVDSDAAYIDVILQRFRQQEFYYTLTPPLLRDNSVDDFLFETRRGFCEHFASAFTTLMRAADIPARVVTGYQGGEYNSLGDYLLVRQSDAHAWSEVWLAGRGWVRVDPTAAVAPERIERSLDAALSDSEFVPGRFLRTNPFFSQVQLTWDAVNNFWNNHIVEFNDSTQRSIMERLGIHNADWRDLGVAFTLTLVTFFLAMAAYLTWRFKPRAADPVAQTYAQLCRKLARAGMPRESCEGPTDYLLRIAQQRPTLATDLHAMRVLYTSLRYGPAPLAGELSRFKFLVNRLRPPT